MTQPDLSHYKSKLEVLKANQSSANTSSNNQPIPNPNQNTGQFSVSSNNITSQQFSNSAANLDQLKTKNNLSQNQNNTSQNNSQAKIQNQTENNTEQQAQPKQPKKFIPKTNEAETGMAKLSNQVLSAIKFFSK